MESSEYQNHCPKSPVTTVDLDITVDEHNVNEGARKILNIIRPTWKDSNIQFKLFTDGITNKLVGCFYRPDCDPGVATEDEENNFDTVQANTVLIRVYGNKTDLLIDRKAETKNIKMLHKYGFAPSLFATFRNGLAYEYVPGVTLKPETVILEQIYSLVAKQMAEMHKVNHDGICDKDKVPMLETKIKKFLNLIPEEFSNPKNSERAHAMQLLPVQRLKDEFDYLYGELKKSNSPIVFSHNDLLLGNVIYTEKQHRVTFIDYEYADYNYQAFDIGNHFTEFPGIDEVDFSLYPNREFQLKWLGIYLKAFFGPSRCVTDNDVERLYVQVNQFALASHYLWFVWGLIQSEYSTIDFDFMTFAINRYKEYIKRRDEFLSLVCEN